jgi:hypothetical protein
MSKAIKNWTITALCLHIIAAMWLFASPTRYGEWQAVVSIAYENIWAEHVADECVSVEGEVCNDV